MLVIIAISLHHNFLHRCIDRKVFELTQSNYTFLTNYMFVFGNPKEILKFYMFPKKNSEKTNKFLTKAQCDRRTKKFLTRVTYLLRTIV